MSATCINPRHGDQPPLADDGIMFCAPCFNRLRNDLDAITSLWSLLDEFVTPGNNGTGGGAAGKPGSRPPCDLDVLDITDARSETSQQLTSWARVVIEDRNLSPRSLDGEQAARLLTVHVDWLAAQPFADEAADEIRTAAYRVRRACRDLPEPPIGKCSSVDPNGERDTCGGPLRWIDGSTAVRCSRCGDTWNEADLPHILRVVAPTAKFPVPREWAQSQYGLTANQLRLWVHRGHVRTYSDGQVDLFDVIGRLTDVS